MRTYIIALLLLFPLFLHGQLKQSNIYETDHAYYQMGGEDFRFNSLKGKVTLVFMWAPWCAGCKDDQPKVHALKEEFNGEDFEILYVAMEQDTEEWEKAVRNRGWEGTYIQLQNDLSNPLSKIVYYPVERNGQQMYQVAVPGYYIIGKDGFGFKTGSIERGTLMEDLRKQFQ